MADWDSFTTFISDIILHTMFKINVSSIVLDLTAYQLSESYSPINFSKNPTANHGSLQNVPLRLHTEISISITFSEIDALRQQPL